jgi:hypothetical protein
VYAKKKSLTIMRLITLIILSLSILILASCDSKEITDKQSDSFIKFYGGPSLDYGVDVEQTSDGGYAILGTITTPDKGTDMCLILTNEFGNSISDIKYYGGGYDDKGTCLHMMDDGAFILMGSYQDSTSGNTHVYIVKTDNAGATLWEKIIEDEGSQEGYDLQVNNSGDLIIVGYTESGMATSATGNQKDIFQRFLNSEGDIIWEPGEIGFADNDVGHNILLGNEENIIVGNTKSRPVGTTRYRSFIIKTNLQGLPSSGFKTLFDTEMDYINYIRELPDGDFLVAGTIVTDNSTNICLMRIDQKSLDIIWSKTFDEIPYTYCTGMELNANEILILGTHEISGSASSMVLIKADLDGSLTNFTEYGLSSQIIGLAFALTDDNGFIFTGSSKTGDNSVITLIKTDSNGGF